MRLRIDWLARVLTVPYLPILGPIHPDQLTAEMFTHVFADILTAEPSNRAATRLLLKEFAPGDEANGACGDSVVCMLDDCPPDIASTFDTFTQAMADHGFAFLNQRRQAGQVDGPILVAQHNGAIVGAIGPLTIMPGRFGAHRLLPQYFGVLPNHRGTGHGRALWRAAQRWATRHRADYQLLQTTVGGASGRLFLAEGLRTLGFAATTAA